MVEAGHFNMARLSCSLVSSLSYYSVFLILSLAAKTGWREGLGTRLGILLLNFDMSNI